jgi:Met-10+ like-protein
MPEDSFLGPHTFFGRLARYPLKLIPPSPILRGPVPGKKWIVGSKRHAFWLGLYEPEMQRRIVKVIRPGGIFYDIGANLGFYSLLASALVGQGRVFAFEPSPDNIAYLRRHVALNECADVEILNWQFAIAKVMVGSRWRRADSWDTSSPKGNCKCEPQDWTHSYSLSRFQRPITLKWISKERSIWRCWGWRSVSGDTSPYYSWQPTENRSTPNAMNCCTPRDRRSRWSRTQSEDRAEIVARPRVR